MTFQKGGTQILNISKRGEPEKEIWGEGNQKGGEIFKKKGGTQIFKLNLGIEMNKNDDF